MTTRVSVKVGLSWSTCAQMGFLLVQCALGLWPLALLHIVAHSLYKAHAFLSAGSAVDEWKIKASTKARPASPLRLTVATWIAVGAALFGVLVIAPRLGSSSANKPSEIAFAVLVGLALVPLVASKKAGGARALTSTATRVVAVVLLYAAWHALAERVVPHPAESHDSIAWTVTGAGFTLLYAVKTALQLRPEGAFARTLRPWLFYGFYVDELFTRLTFRIWPPRLPEEARSSHAVQAPLAVQVHT